VIIDQARGLHEGVADAVPTNVKPHFFRFFDMALDSIELRDVFATTPTRYQIEFIFSFQLLNERMVADTL
jgi:hypothetical protein